MTEPGPGPLACLPDAIVYSGTADSSIGSRRGRRGSLVYYPHMEGSSLSDAKPDSVGSVMIRFFGSVGMSDPRSGWVKR